MNYIKRLQVIADARAEQIADCNDNLNYLLAYLQSDKFHKEPTVQVQDVLNRLQSLKYSLSDSCFDEKKEKWTEQK